MTEAAQPDNSSATPVASDSYPGNGDDAATDDDLIGTGETARLLKVSQTTVGRIAGNGSLRVHSYTPGGQRRFRRADVLEYKQSLIVKQVVSTSAEG